jgi:hypothetical protein
MNEEYIGKDPLFSEILDRWDTEVDEKFRSIDCCYGWKDLIKRCHQDLVSIDPDYKVVQIKEKFGMLRYYFTPSVEQDKKRMDKISFSHERESVHICEACGAPGILQRRKDGSSYFRTLCEEHHS